MDFINDHMNLEELDTTYLTVQGDQLALEDRKTGKVYLTSKIYINKLFDEMGYKSLGVVNILKQFAGKIISEVGELKRSKVYVDEARSVCLVTPASSLEWVKGLSDFFDEKGFTFIKQKNTDDYRYWDEFTVQSPNGTYFSVYIDLADEYVQIFSLDDINEKMKIMNEGTYKFGEEGSLEDAKVLLNSKISLEGQFDMTADLSLAEYMDFLHQLGITRKKKGGVWTLTDLGEEELITGAIPNIENAVEGINESTWLQSHIRSSGVKFDELSSILAYKFDAIRVYDYWTFYAKNLRETSDYFQMRG